MPDVEFPKLRPHPSKARVGSRVVERRVDSVRYVELSVTSNYTFLNGASHPDELVERAADLGHAAVAITDKNTLAGIVRAHVSAKQQGIRLVVGCRLVFSDAPATLVYPTDRASYARLCRLLTLGKRRAPKGECHLSLDDFISYQDGLLAVIETPDDIDDLTHHTIEHLADVFCDDRFSLAVSCAYDGCDAERLARVAGCAVRTGVPMVATNRVLYHDSQRRCLQDILTCIRHGCTIEQAGFRLNANAERHLKPPGEMARLFAVYPEALERTVAIAERARFALDELRYEYPAEPCPPGITPREYLEREVWAGAKRRYPHGVPEKTRLAIRHELALIRELCYEAYFLTCYDIVVFARSRGILCQGRGGAANSAVCYCLGITEVDPATHSLLFERFISRERNEPPDIDIDFEHERREEVLQYIYSKYGRERAALTAEVITYRGRSAVREVSKAMGLSGDTIDAMAKNLDRWGESANAERIRDIGLNPNDAIVQRVIRLAGDLKGFPRHLSQHVGGFVITRSSLSDLVPVENAAMEGRTVIEWDKDDIDAMGMLKIDCLGLGMLTCIRKALVLLERCGERTCMGAPWTVPDIMLQEAPDDGVYEMISRADTVGVFQIESRAQMSMLPRLKPRCFYDLVIEVAIVRPGPIQGGMVHPYLRRREGTEEVVYPSVEVENVLKRTLGVPLFQEQAMQLAIVAAGFTPDEADGLRRSMAAWKRNGNAIAKYGEHLICGMVANGYDRSFAERCFEQIKGFSEYGFPESHAASFAILVYVSCWLKHHFPAAFAAALINSQPMGFYAPAQLVRDAQQHGVEVRAIDVNHSQWDCTLEHGQGGPALRLGMRLVKGMPEAEANMVVAQAFKPYTSVEDVWKRAHVGTKAMRALARADAFGSLGLDRQQSIWQTRALRDVPLPLFENSHIDGQVPSSCGDGLDQLPDVHPLCRVLHDYNAIGLSLKSHPIIFLRDHLDAQGVTPAAGLSDERRFPNKSSVRVAGVVLSRQRPGTASGVVFVTLEDETGIVNLIIWSDTFERYRKVARLSTTLIVSGTVERQGEIVHVHAVDIGSVDKHFPDLVLKTRNFH